MDPPGGSNKELSTAELIVTTNCDEPVTSQEADVTETNGTLVDEPAPTQASEPSAQPLSTTPPATTVDTPPQARDLRICGVCDKEPGKYKCPRCGMFYCSVPCSKTHKANHPPDPPPQPPPPSAPAKGAKRPREPEDPYSILLDHRRDLERLFERYPNLQADLIQIERQTLPPPDTQSVSGGLPTTYRPPQQKHQEAWTRQVGLRKGAAALKKARMDPSEDGDAVREYCELVLYLLSRSRERREEEALDVVRRETADEERGVIRGLIRMDEE